MFASVYFLSCLIATTAALLDNGKLTTLNGINYYVGGVAVSKLSISVTINWNWTNADLVPLTVIRSNATTFTSDDLEESIAKFKTSDDVFGPDFLEVLFLEYDGYGQGSIDSAFHLHSESARSKLTFASSKYHPRKHFIKADLVENLPNGPYFISPRTGYIFKAYRLYSDHQLAFTEAVISDERGTFMPLPTVTEGSMSKSVAVPSRLYNTPTADKPLAGLRCGVKDIFDLKGIRTSGGNRAFYDLYPAKNTTGTAVQRLIDAGVVVVGKMGTVQFANGDNPTADWVDFHCPFNPRGDGYQAPGGSSSGPGAGIASYDWLDIAIGSDTGGSMRSPGGMQGVFANRPSTGAIDLDNVLPLCHDLDTAGVFARNAEIWSSTIHAWYPNFTDYKRYPARIYYQNSSFPEINTLAGALLDGFVQKVERFIGTKREHVDISRHWMNTHPKDTPSNVTDLLNETYAILTSVGQYRSLTLPFYADYAARNEGRRPFVNPGPLKRWQWGQDNGGDHAYNLALKNKTIFREWWETEGYGKANPKTCSEGIYLYPYSKGETQYRNVYFDAPTAPPMGFKDGRISNMADVPDVVVPVGEIPYNSTVSLKIEHMPVTMSFVAARGCDLMLANLILDLQNKGILKPVSTGPKMYP
ncbi:hypothetical protein N7462_007106 [Penicillium macrosclerotiorum]|uniref:uncharacterized protein n=1 Tax=Penicillium macrosclerotiorum TaxID=303699 RepID=UPI0025485EEF|nr:uncharacterized protein N7462_007106 [Penicillium macrosclerotiorum]KAJ5678862.1 hypothetical protein N7462_007106 [Penicillium macrosclerotiorum]